jgi:uncharacterized protein YjbI with pentapeptide repeats
VGRPSGIVVALIASLTIAGSTGMPMLAAAQSDDASLTSKKLHAEVEKLEAEVEKLDDERGWVADVIRLAPFITAIVALAGLLITLWKQRAETNRQRTLDREERSKARIQRFDEQFQQTAMNLASNQGEIRAAAAASIATFMRPEYEDFHERLFLLLLGALRFPRKDASDKLLIRSFQVAARDQIPAMRLDPTFRIDLTNCWLERVQLRKLDLTDSDMAFAHLHDADLTESILRRTRGFEVDLSAARLGGCDLQEARLNKATLVKARLTDANLVSAQLKDADASGANFCGARMQEAHLERSTLHGARFDGANLDNAFFAGTSLDEATLRNVALRAVAWRKANWDPSTWRELQRISAAGVP